MANHHELSNFIWQIADLLRGPYRPPQHERVMLPMAGASQVETDQPYAQSASLPADYRHGCATYYINLFDANPEPDRNIQIFNRSLGIPESHIEIRRCLFDGDFRK